LLWTRLVVVSELPVRRDTLLLRLLGADRVLEQAIAELKALEAAAPERTLALPILLRLRLEVPSDPASQTSDDREFLMQTQDIVEAWRQEARTEMQAEAVLTVLRVRGIDVPDAVRERILIQKDQEQLKRWLEKAAVASSIREVLEDPS
jgi:hypothetical protein